MAKEYDTRHGGPYERGAADSWYMRPADPHYFMGGTYTSQRVGKADMTAEEIEAYHAGYAENEAAGMHKNYY